MVILRAERISKWFEGAQILREVSFSLAEGEILCLLGPSGSGKTTLLRIIAGLETPDAGQVLWKGKDLASVPPHQRGFGLMFQEYALFPHKNVLENVAFGLRMQGLSPQEVNTRGREVLALVGLAGFAERDVNRLSGGERQRVALARSLAPRPRLLMLDEPLGALDRTLRERLLGELRGILRQVGQTAMYVTHDQEEAFALADRVLIMHDGRIVQAGTPEAVYRHPADEFVARFLGLTNLLPAHLVDPGPPPRAQTPAGRVTVEGELDPKESSLVLLPQTGSLCPTDNSGDNVISGVVRDCAFQGQSYRLGIEVTGGTVLQFDLAVDPEEVPKKGELVCVQVSGATLVDRQHGS
jgi:ABC-type Fe3+/spermidine/putrescine transport system ATPase subunit